MYEITGDYDISAYVKVANTLDLNNFIEELRAMPGVKLTDTRVVLKKHAENRKLILAGNLGGDIDGYIG